MPAFNYAFVRPNGTRVSTDDAVNQLLFGVNSDKHIFFKTRKFIVEYLIPQLNNGFAFFQIRQNIIGAASDAYRAYKNSLDNSDEQESDLNKWTGLLFHFQIMNQLDLWSFKVRLAHVEEDLPPTA